MPRLVDLSQEIYQGMGVYPGHLKTVIWEHASHAETAKLFEGGFSFQSSGLMIVAAYRPPGLGTPPGSPPPAPGRPPPPGRTGAVVVP